MQTEGNNWPEPVPETYYLSGLMIHGLIEMVEQFGVPYTFGKAMQYCVKGFLTAGDLEPVIRAMIDHMARQEEARSGAHGNWTKEEALASLMRGLATQGKAWTMYRAVEFFRANVLDDEDLAPVYAAVETDTWTEDLIQMVEDETRRRNCQVIPATDTKA